MLNHTDAHLKIAVNINYAHAAMCKAGLPVADKTELKRVLRQSAVIGFNAVRHTLIPKFCKANHSVRSLILGGKPMKCWIFEV